MKYPKLRAVEGRRQTVSTFLGLDRSPRPADGAFYHMENLTSDHFPVLSPRTKRSVYADTKALGLLGADVLAENGAPQQGICYVDAVSQRLVVGQQTTKLAISGRNHKALVSMGAYVLVFPDKRYINALDPEDYGSIEAIQIPEAPVELTVSGPDGKAGEGCIKLTCPGIGAGFRTGDWITCSGFTAANINGTACIRGVGADWLTIDGKLSVPATQQPDEETLRIARTVPDMDFVIECGNRLWGCRYGIDDDDRVVNEIYCSRLGDFRNWHVFEGLSTDAWVASVGSDGPFTGAVAHLGHPLFFKENCLHKVHISATGAHQIVDTPCRGVQMHCGKSLAVVGETLYYKSASDIMAYDGAFPRPVSTLLGDCRTGGICGFTPQMHNGQHINAIGAAAGSKYYLSLCNRQGVFELLVYDTERQLWHREDSLQLLHMCSLGTDIYGINAAGRILLLTGDTCQQPEQTVAWLAETGDLGLESPDKKYISRLTLRMALAVGGQCDVEVCYDHSGLWQPLATIRGNGLGSFPVTVRPRRCDHMRLRLRGQGDMQLYSMTKTVTEGSDTI